MSKINITIDTVAHTVDCKLDGTPVENVNGVYLYKYCDCEGEDKVCVDLSVEAEELGDGIKKYSRIVTAQHKDLAKATIQGESPDKSLVIIEDSAQITKTISRWLGR